MNDEPSPLNKKVSSVTAWLVIGVAVGIALTAFFAEPREGSGMESQALSIGSYFSQSSRLSRDQLLEAVGRLDVSQLRQIVRQLSTSQLRRFLGSIPPPALPPGGSFLLPPAPLPGPGPASENPNLYSGKFGFLVPPTGKILPGGENGTQEFWFLGHGYQHCALHRMEGQTSVGIITREKVGSYLAKVGIGGSDPFNPKLSGLGEELNLRCGDSLDPATNLSTGDWLSLKGGATSLSGLSDRFYDQSVALYGRANAPIGGTNTPGPRYSFRAEVAGRATTVTGDPANPTKVLFPEVATATYRKSDARLSWDVPSVYKGCLIARGGSKLTTFLIDYGTPAFFRKFFPGSRGNITLTLGLSEITRGGDKTRTFNLICSGPSVAPSVTSVKFTIR